MNVWIVRSNLSDITQHLMVFSIKLFWMFLANVNINLNHKLMKLGERCCWRANVIWKLQTQTRVRCCTYKERINKNFLLKFSQKGWSLRTFFVSSQRHVYGAPNTACARNFNQTNSDEVLFRFFFTKKNSAYLI